MGDTNEIYIFKEREKEILENKFLLNYFYNWYTCLSEIIFVKDGQYFLKMSLLF